MTIPYRTQKILKRIGITLAVLAVVLLLILVFRYLWLERFVVYSRDQGGFVDSNLGPVMQGEFVKPPAPLPTVPIEYVDKEDEQEESTELTQMIGYYIDAEALTDISTVRQQLDLIPSGTPIMLDVKDIYGSFFYSSGVGAQRNSAIDTAAMDQLIQLLRQRNFYTIARLPAFRDYQYGLNHVPDGLHHISGGYLWADDYYCYWLNPASQGTISYLVQMVTELKGLGFDEVVFYDFCFPETGEILFNGDKTQAIATAASTLVTSCTTDTFAVSFTSSDPTFALPEGRSRLYMTGVSAAEAATLAQQTGLADPSIRLVFQTNVHDTRFDVYSVLRPLDAAH